MVRKPRNTKFTHSIRANETQAVNQQKVTLTLHDPNSPQQGPNTPTKNRPNQTLAHSVSSPALRGAWSMRTLENAIPPLNIRSGEINYFIKCDFAERGKLLLFHISTVLNLCLSIFFKVLLMIPAMLYYNFCPMTPSYWAYIQGEIYLMTKFCF